MHWGNARRYALGFSLTVFATEDLAPMRGMALERLESLHQSQKGEGTWT
jgi:hypothetical protein